MKTLPMVLLGVAVLAVIIVFTVFLFQKGRRDTPRPVALPPPRKPDVSEKILARLINAVNYDMRSLQLGSWFLMQLRRQATSSSADACVRGLDFEGIAAKVPGANPVTRAEVATHLRDLVYTLCATKDTSSLVQAIDDLEYDALNPRTGLLIGMPGYRRTSPVPLPQ